MCIFLSTVAMWIVFFCLQWLCGLYISVYSGYVDKHPDTEAKEETDVLLLDVWLQLMAAGPGSTHLELINIILKNDSYTLWKYMKVGMYL